MGFHNRVLCLADIRWHIIAYPHEDKEWHDSSSKDAEMMNPGDILHPCEQIEMDDEYKRDEACHRCSPHVGWRSSLIAEHLILRYEWLETDEKDDKSVENGLCLHQDEILRVKAFPLLSNVVQFG